MKKKGATTHPCILHSLPLVSIHSTDSIAVDRLRITNPTVNQLNSLVSTVRCVYPLAHSLIARSSHPTPQ